MLFTPAAFAIISGRAPARAAAVAAPAQGDWPVKVRAISGPTQGSLISAMTWKAPRRVGLSVRATFREQDSYGSFLRDWGRKRTKGGCTQQ